MVELLCAPLTPACSSTPRAAALACDSAEIDKCDELYGRTQGKAAQRSGRRCGPRKEQGMERAWSA